MAAKLDDASLAVLERENPDGLSSQHILDLLREAGVRLTEATLRKYIQLGLLPRSTRVGKKGKHQGSQGLYPASVVRQILQIREMMAQDYTIEQIQREILFVRGDIEQLERILGKVFEAFETAIEQKSGEPTQRAVVAELAVARRVAAELTEKLGAIEARLIARAQVARAVG